LKCDSDANGPLSTRSLSVPLFVCGPQNVPDQFMDFHENLYALNAGVAQSVLKIRLQVGWQGFNFRRNGIILFVAASRPALGPTQPPIQWVSRAITPGVKRPGREADHTPPSNAEV